MLIKKGVFLNLPTRLGLGPPGGERPALSPRGAESQGSQRFPPHRGRVVVLGFEGMGTGAPFNSLFRIIWSFPHAPICWGMGAGGVIFRVLDGLRAKLLIKPTEVRSAFRKGS